jgi:hypothetical protein
MSFKAECRREYLDIGVDENTVLKETISKWCGKLRIGCTSSLHDHLCALVDKVMNLRVPYKVGI